MEKAMGRRERLHGQATRLGCYGSCVERVNRFVRLTPCG